MRYILETERVRLREFRLDDTAFIINLLNSPGWIEFIGQRNVTTDEQAADYLRNVPLKSYRENGFGLWLVEKKDDQKAIGMCGIIKREQLEHPDIGFAFLPDYAAKGYAFETATATLSLARDRFKIFTMWAIAMPNNARSIRLLEKIGFTCIRTVNFPGSQQELLLFSN
jgi:RimJ/RimL family protein N-acetyltransferase